MRLTVLFAGAALVLAASPALAQLAGAGNLVNTQGQQPTWPGNNHQSTTMIAGGGGTRGVLYNVNGGDLAPGLQQSDIKPDPSAISSRTKDRSVGAWVEAGPQNGGVGNGATVRTNVSNNLGAGPSSTYRSVDLNLPSAAGGAVGKAAGGNLAGGNLGGGNLAGGNLANAVTSKLPNQ